MQAAQRMQTSEFVLGHTFFDSTKLLTLKIEFLIPSKLPFAKGGNDSAPFYKGDRGDDSFHEFPKAFFAAIYPVLISIPSLDFSTMH